MNFFYDVGKLFLRVSFSIMLLPHGWSKVNRLFADEIKFSDPIGIGELPSLILVTFAELIVPILIILGFKTRWFSIFPIITMIVVAFIHKWDQGFFEIEKALLFLSGFIAISLIGPGKYSIDQR
ncbi:MAG: DoxX family protein [Flavobacteriaceae bacterium]|nr:DoxX family protein [Flavobacteriaceae bacterium]